jgi:hypothetical protein
LLAAADGIVNIGDRRARYMEADMLSRILTGTSSERQVLRHCLSQRVAHITRSAAVVLALLLVVWFAQWPRPAFAHEYGPPPLEFSAAACYGLVGAAGRPIAWARWEKHLSLNQTRSAPFRPDTPAWVIDLVNGWIDDAYQWRATDQQIRQWAAELGSVEDLPSADALSVPETIAIWMRRIGRQCNERDVRAGADVDAGASAKLIGGEVSVAE